MKKQKICYIFAAGELYQGPKSISDDSLVIAADGGRYHADTLGIKPDVYLGDFDSSKLPDACKNYIVYPSEKDYTDTFLAIEYGVKQGYQDFSVYGALGGKRIEHTLANIQCLAYFAKRDITVRLYGEDQIVTAVSAAVTSPKALTFDSTYSGYISLFAIDSKVDKLTIEGLKYPLENKTLFPDFPLGISNEFCKKEAKISFTSGTLLLVYRQNDI